MKPNPPLEPTGSSWRAFREHAAPAAQRPRSAERREPMRGTVILILLLIMLRPASAWADCPPGQECPPSMVEESVEEADAFRRAEEDLAGIYNQAIAKIGQQVNVPSPDRDQWRNSLRQAQDSWRIYRDTTCGELMSYQYWEAQGALQFAAKWECLKEKTQVRIQEIKGYIHLAVWRNAAPPEPALAHEKTRASPNEHEK